MLASTVVLHIFAGAIALLSGYAVIVCSKGKKAHKFLGRIYVIAMLVLGTTGTYVAIMRDVPLSILNGLVLCYFVLSALNIAWQPANRVNVFDKLLFVFAFAITAGFVWYAYQTTLVADGKLGGFSIHAYIVFGSVMALCSVADYRFIKKGGLSGKDKLVRHLWRMFFPLFMSTAAFFLGQAQHLPEGFQRIEFLLTPVVLVIVTAIYWVIKTQPTGIRPKF
jgi:uncharacterized membrane protein